MTNPHNSSERDAGLQKAIAAAGGIRALARALGRNQALVARWTKVPYEYLLEVEQVTGVSREILRPELFLREGKIVEAST